MLVGFAVRALLIVAQLKLHIFEAFYDAADSVLYRELAEQLFEHGRYWFNDLPTAYVTPGYPLFLAGLYFVSRSTMFIAFAQVTLGALTVGFVADTARRLGGERAAWAAGGISAIYPHFLFWTGYVLTETLYLFFFAVATWATVRLVTETEQSTWGGVVAGASWGAAVIVRPTPLLFALTLIGVGFLLARWRRVAGIALLGFLAIWLPWVVRNAVTMDAFVPTSTEAGVILWQGNSPGATGGTRGYVDAIDFDDLPGVERLNEIEQERAYREAALDWISQNPERVVILAPRKLANMFRPTYSGASAFNTVVTLATYVPLLALGIAGLGVLWRDHGAGGKILVALVAYHVVVHGLLTGMIRFRLPVELVLSISAGTGIMWLIGRRPSAST